MHSATQLTTFPYFIIHLIPFPAQLIQVLIGGITGGIARTITEAALQTAGMLQC